MTRFSASDGLHVCFLTPRKAEEHTRRIHNVPDHVELGWKPYTIIVTSYGGVPHTAFHSLDRFRSWIGNDHRVKLGRAQFSGIRSGRIERR